VAARGASDDPVVLGEVTPDDEGARQADGATGPDLLAVVAHELRTPLTALSGYAAMLSRWNSGMSPLEVDVAIEVIARQAQRLSEVLDDLMDLGRVRQQAGVRAPVDLGAVITEALDGIASPDRSTITVDVRDAPEPPLVLADRTRLMRVLVNLLSNAFRYGGPSVAIVLRHRAGVVTVDVEDDGEGLPDELVARVFEPFTRGAPSEDGSAMPSGTGLGLSIAKQAIESMGGHLQHSSVDPHGARFSISLPLAPDEVDLDMDVDVSAVS
jgi:two-component system OmpR family sensor kinase